jgi:5-dehydro-2-deoxygluconokinase
VKVLCFYHPDDSDDLKQDQERQLLMAYEACRKVGRELLVEIIAGKHRPLTAQTIPTILTRLYDLGIKPDWWKLEPQASAAAWEAIDAVIAARDVYCRGIVLLGLEAPEEELAKAFAATRAASLVKGFAVGRTLFADAAAKWLADEIDDNTAVDDMAGRYERLCMLWQDARK